MNNDKLKTFLNTAYGSYLKVFLSFALVQLAADLNDMTIYEALGHYENYVRAGIAGLLPIVINGLNDKDPRYGKKAKPEPFKPEKG